MQYLQDQNPLQGTTFFWNESKLREFFTQLRAYYKYLSKESAFYFLVNKPSMLNILVRCCAEKWNHSGVPAQQVLLNWNWKKKIKVSVIVCALSCDEEPGENSKFETKYSCEHLEFSEIKHS